MNTLYLDYHAGPETKLTIETKLRKTIEAKLSYKAWYYQLL